MLLRYMATLAAASISCSMIHGAIAASTPSVTALRNARCSSSSDTCTACLAHITVGHGRFCQQYLQRRDIGVPFDQGRHIAKPLQRLGIELPDRRRDPAAVGIDQATGTALEPGQVH